MIKLQNAYYFDPLPLDLPYSKQTQSKDYNYGYWFKYQPLLQQSNSLVFGDTSTDYVIQNQYLVGFELSDENKLSLWHYSDSFNHQVTITSPEGLKTYQFQQDLLKYEGQWNFFGIQIINDDQYQIIFSSNSLQIIVIDGQLNRKLEQDYYIGCFGQFFDSEGQKIYFQQFQGRLTDFIELPEIITESNFEYTVLNTYQSYIQMFDYQLQQYFDILDLDGQILKKYSYLEYREGTRYGISMWVKSNVEQYTLALNYTVLRATLNEYYTDNYLGDRQLLIQYQIGVVPSENIVYVTTYTFQSPIYTIQQKSDKDWIQIQDQDLIQGLRQWHFIQFEYGRTITQPPTYNSLFTLDLPTKEKQFNRDWNRDNNHFTGVPIYFYLGGGLSQFENKFIGTISKFTFISYNTGDMEFNIQCNSSCLTCNGPTASDCLTCSSQQNRVFSQNQCVCKQGYVAQSTASYCELLATLYPMIEVLETEYKCPLGYDQCNNGKIVCSFGYFLFFDNNCYQCPLQSEYQDNAINCVECLFFPNDWLLDDRCSTSMQLVDNLFNQIYGDLFVYTSTVVDNSLQTQAEYYYDIFNCPEGFGFNYYTFECNQCLDNCLYCSFSYDLNYFCSKCLINYSLSNNLCIKCGLNCKECIQDVCLVCKEGSFLTLDKINCNECTIQNCKHCYQFYRSKDLISISLDLKFQRMDPIIDGIITSCARCDDNYVINGDACISISSLNQFQIESCLTGIVQNENFQCLIGLNQENSLQLNNCSLIKNCYSCFIRYPINPWCIQCVNGYYVQLQDGSCVPCPDSCASCIQQNSVYKDSWKVNIRALYYYQFQSHKFEDFAIDTNLHIYEIICTVCKDGQILSDKTCIPGCASNCEICEAKEGNAVCMKCKNNQFGALRSIDSNFQCLDCPQHCNACIARNSTVWTDLNFYFNPSKYLKYQHYCYSFDQNYFLDNEFHLPVKCENSKKCFKSLRISVNIYCDSNFEWIISNCRFSDIEQCLIDIFNQELIDYIKQSVIKEVELIFTLKFSSCVIRKQIIISQQLKESVYTISSITLIIQASQQTQIQFNSNIIFSNFDNYQISNLTILANNNIKFQLNGQNVKLNQIILKSFNYYFSQIYFILNDITELEINNLTVQSEYRVRFMDLIQVGNLLPYTSNTSILIQNVFINQSQFFDQGFLNFTISNANLTLNVNNFTILDTRFENCSSLFKLGQGVKISSTMKNIKIIKNRFQSSSFIQWRYTFGQPQLQITLMNNDLVNSTFIKIPCHRYDTIDFLGRTNFQINQYLYQ
ncbi:hypothetical protein pb186bvf_017977, partial [Paramecium bursaria]